MENSSERVVAKCVCGWPLYEGDMYCGNCGKKVLYCAKCGAVMADDAKFCMQCGHCAVIKCAGCGSVLPDSAKFCPKCGTSVSESCKRKTNLSMGEKLFLEGKFADAFPVLEKEANSGNPRAMYLLARYYDDSYNVVKCNEDISENWLRKAKPYNEPLSTYEFADRMMDDQQEAQEIFKEIAPQIKQMAENGDVLAQLCLGEIYEFGDGLPQDDEQAVEWYRKAAEKGDPGAQFALGDCFYDGEGVSQDYEKAVEWYRKSAEQGDLNAQYSLGNCYYDGEGVSQDYEKAVEWYRKAAKQGDSAAQCNLGDCYSNGEGVSQDYEQAVEWYRKATEQEVPYAQFALGKCYYDGKGVSQDYEKAVEWYRKAAEQGDSVAQYALGECYYNGEGVSQDYEKAVGWYRKSAEQGNPDAQAALDLPRCKGQVGEYVKFGRYTHEERGVLTRLFCDEELEPIEWLVLENDGRTALLVSRYGLDCQPFHHENVDVSWRNCDLRKWLNGNFLNKAFNTDEQRRITESKISTERCGETQDKVFCLSIKEANKYFRSDDARKCQPTAYAVSRNAYKDNDTGCCWFWLRSPGFYASFAASVRSHGDVVSYGSGVDLVNFAVRPALRIML